MGIISDTQTAYKQFQDLVDKQAVEVSDAVVVLRNLSVWENEQRIKHGTELVYSGKAPLLVWPYETNTHTEARTIFHMAMELCWHRVILVTHKYHSYRAMLTFIKMFEASGVELYCSYIDSDLNRDEPVKIAEYQNKGHVATYEEGVHYLNGR